MPKELDRRYTELVRLAYLVLPGDKPRKYRLALARRIVEESLPYRAARNQESTHSAARTRVLRRALRPRYRLRIGLGRWLDELPPVLPDTDLLRELNPEVRAAYVLRRLGGERYFTVRDQLAELGVREPGQAVRAAEALPAPAAELPELWVRRGARHHSRLPEIAATGLTAVLVGGIVMTQNSQIHVRPLRTGLAAWPARGALARDRSLIGGAVSAWRHRTSVGRPVVLYAGRIGGTAIALLRDGDRLARYTATGTLDLFPAGDGTTPVVLTEGRYLVPPGVSSVQALRLADGTRTPVAVRAGVTAVLPASDGTCGHGPVLELTRPGGTRTAADLSGFTLAALQAPPGTPACALPQPTREVASATAAEFWSGTLPGGMSGRWICTRYTHPDGSTESYATLFTASGAHHVTGGCGTVSDRVVSGVWWRPGGKGAWLYLAAASQGFKLQATGPFRTTEYAGGLFVGKAHKGPTPPATPVVLTLQ